jgi:hypothetical protein
MSSTDRDNAYMAFFQNHPNLLDNDSDIEEESWVRRGCHNASRAARIDAIEADGSDSDGELVFQERKPSTIGGLRRQIQREAAQGNVSEADQDIFEEYFGDRYRRPTSPTGRCWQNTARIAAGARISNQIYGPSIDAIRNTSLMEPEFVSAGPPSGMCASRRVCQRRIDAEAEVARQIREEDRAMQAHLHDLAYQQSLDRVADANEDALREHRRSHNLDTMRNELKARAMAFKEEDPAGFDKWAGHIVVAHKCSTSKSRQHQIIQWYTCGVPGRVLRQVRRVELYYTTEAYLEERLLDAHVYTSARRSPDMRIHLKDDDRWAGNKRQLFFGYDPEKSVNGFSDYVPKGEGIAIIKHLRANFTARKVRLMHASTQHYPILVDMMYKFARAAMAGLEAARASAGDPASQLGLGRAIDGISQLLSRPTEYEPERESSSSAVGVQGPDGDDGNESDGSDVASITNDFARLLEEAELDRQYEAREGRSFAQLVMQSGDEQGTGGGVPPDGEEDVGDASMDEGSSD